MIHDNPFFTNCLIIVSKMTKSAEKLISSLRNRGEKVYFNWGAYYIRDGVKLIIQAIGMAPPSGSIEIADLADQLEELAVDSHSIQILTHFTAELVSCSEPNGRNGMVVSRSSYW